MIIMWSFTTYMDFSLFCIERLLNMFHYNKLLVTLKYTITGGTLTYITMTNYYNKWIAVVLNVNT